MKKGMVFALDAAVAATILILIIMNSFYYFSTSSRESFSQIQLLKIGADIITVFEREGYIEQVIRNDDLITQNETRDITEAELPINTSIPPNYQLVVQVSDLKESLVDQELVNNRDRINVSTLPLENAGSYLLQVNISSVSGSAPDFFTQVNAGPFQTINDIQTGGIYTFNKSFTFIEGINWVTMWKRGGSVKVAWFRVLGSEAYAGSTNETAVAPKDRFVGTGERFITAYHPTFDKWTTHWVRFKVWLKP